MWLQKSLPLSIIIANCYFFFIMISLFIYRSSSISNSQMTLKEAVISILVFLKDLFIGASILYIFLRLSHREEETETEWGGERNTDRETEISHPLMDTCQLDTIARAKPGQSQEPECPSKCACRWQGPSILTLFCSFSGTLERNWSEMKQMGLELHSYEM